MARQTPPIQGVEIHSDQPDIQTVAESDLAKLAADEQFMAEEVVIRIHEANDESAAQIIPVTVNESCVYIQRGMPTRIRRCFLERLARSKETRYTQVRHPMFPDQSTLNPRTALSYPFEVIEDKNPRGRAWLSNILAEPS